MTNLEQLQNMINTSNNIVFFGGAGVSTESGLPDFRGSNGLYNQNQKCNPEMILSHTYFENHPKEFYEFYKDNLLNLDVKPNAAHFKLAELEKAGKLLAVITQNVDGLHQAAGSKNVLELHGTAHENYCLECGEVYDAYFVKNSKGVPHCTKCGGVLKPNLVLYDEMLDLDVLTQARRTIAKADMLIVAGTSLKVYPAADLVNSFFGKYLVIINKTKLKTYLPNEVFMQENVSELFAKLKI